MKKCRDKIKNSYTKNLLNHEMHKEFSGISKEFIEGRTPEQVAKIISDQYHQAMVNIQATRKQFIVSDRRAKKLYSTALNRITDFVNGGGTIQNNQVHSWFTRQISGYYQAGAKEIESIFAGLTELKDDAGRRITRKFWRNESNNQYVWESIKSGKVLGSGTTEQQKVAKFMVESIHKALDIINTDYEKMTYNQLVMTMSFDIEKAKVDYIMKNTSLYKKFLHYLNGNEITFSKQELDGFHNQYVDNIKRALEQNKTLTPEDIEWIAESIYSDQMGLNRQWASTKHNLERSYKSNLHKDIFSRYKQLHRYLDVLEEEDLMRIVETARLDTPDLVNKFSTKMADLNGVYRSVGAKPNETMAFVKNRVDYFLSQKKDSLNLRAFDHYYDETMEMVGQYLGGNRFAKLSGISVELSDMVLNASRVGAFPLLIMRQIDDWSGSYMTYKAIGGNGGETALSGARNVDLAWRTLVSLYSKGFLVAKDRLNMIFPDLFNMSKEEQAMLEAFLRRGTYLYNFASKTDLTGAGNTLAKVGLFGKVANIVMGGDIEIGSSRIPYSLTGMSAWNDMMNTHNHHMLKTVMEDMLKRPFDEIMDSTGKYQYMRNMLVELGITKHDWEIMARGVNDGDGWDLNRITFKEDDYLKNMIISKDNIDMELIERAVYLDFIHSGEYRINKQTLRLSKGSKEKLISDAMKNYKDQFPQLEALEDMLQYVDYIKHTGGSNIDIIFKSDMKGVETYKDTIQKVLRWTFKDEYLDYVRNKMAYMNQESIVNLTEQGQLKDVLDRWNKKVEWKNADGEHSEVMKSIYSGRRMDLEYKFKAFYNSLMTEVGGLEKNIIDSARSNRANIQPKGFYNFMRMFNFMKGALGKSKERYLRLLDSYKETGTHHRNEFNRDNARVISDMVTAIAITTTYGAMSVYAKDVMAGRWEDKDVDWQWDDDDTWKFIGMAGLESTYIGTGLYVTRPLTASLDFLRAGMEYISFDVEDGNRYFKSGMRRLTTNPMLQNIVLESAETIEEF